jgi:hypothetical protein
MGVLDYNSALMTTYRQILQIVFVAVFAMSTLVYADGVMAMSGEMAPTTMQSMNLNDCDDCEPGDVSCEICVFACVTPLAVAMNSSPSFLISAFSLYEVDDREKYHSYISPLDPFPPRVLSSV